MKKNTSQPKQTKCQMKPEFKCHWKRNRNRDNLVFQQLSVAKKILKRSNSANSMESFYSAPMFVKRSCKPELVSNTNDSDLENDVEILLDREDDGTYI